MSNDNGEIDQKTEDFIATVNARREVIDYIYIVIVFLIFQMYTKAVRDDKSKITELNDRLNSELGVSVPAAAREQYIKEMQDALQRKPADE